MSSSDPTMGPATRAFHLVVLWSFAVASPLFQVLTDAPAFFTARDMGPIDVWTICLGLVFVVPAILAGLSALVFRLSRPLGNVVHVTFVAALLVMTAAPPLERALEPLGSPAVPLALALALGAMGAVLYVRWTLVREVVSVGAIAPLAFAGVFLFDPNVAAVRSARVADLAAQPVTSTSPIVLLIFDELPLFSLLDERLEINETLFPNFAKLASDGTWFRNASAVHATTEDNFVSIMTGTFPGDRPHVPDATVYPLNLFSWLKPTHTMLVREAVTRLRPLTRGEDGDAKEDDAETGDAAEPSDADPGYLERTEGLAVDLAIVYAHVVIPERYGRWLPSLDGTWQNFAAARPAPAEPAAGGGRHPGVRWAALAAKHLSETARDYRGRDFENFVRRIGRSAAPALFFAHVLLPHSPFIYMPDGEYYPASRGFVGTWGEAEWPTTLAFQRHLAQVGAVDRLLGLVIERLERLGMYDETLIVVLSDHGVSFRPGRNARYFVDETLDDILRVLCIVKRPGQRAGTVDDRNFEHPDVLPTIADALGERVPWPVDGHSGFDEAAPERPQKRIRDHAHKLWTVAAELPAELPGLRRKIELFGPSPSWPDIFALGPRPDLVGRPVSALELDQDEVPGATALVDHYEWYGGHGEGQRKPTPRQKPFLVKGRITVPAGTRRPTQVAVALNGTIRAVTYTYDRADDEIAFDALLPPDVFRGGANELQLFDLRDGVRARPIDVAPALG